MKILSKKFRKKFNKKTLQNNKFICLGLMELNASFKIKNGKSQIKTEKQPWMEKILINF